MRMHGTAGRTANGCPPEPVTVGGTVGTVAEPVTVPEPVTVGRLSEPVGTVAPSDGERLRQTVAEPNHGEPVTVATAHRNGTGRGGESGRARTRRRHKNATAGGCGAFGGRLSEPAAPSA